MKTLHLSIIAILVFSVTIPAWATDLTVNLSTSGTPTKATFKFLESAFINYPNGGKLKDLLAGKTYTINFTENSNNPSVQDLMHQLNTALARDQKSPVIITDLTVQYTAIILGDDKSASIDYNLQLTPTLTSYVMKKGDSNGNPTIIDAVWMGFVIKDPVIIKTVEYGDVEINTPISFLKKVTPDVYSNIRGTKADDALKNNLIDASGILAVPLDAWIHLFDPAYTLSETSSYGYKGQKVAITTYTMGQECLSMGVMKPIQKTLDFSADTNYQLTIVQHPCPSTATVNIDGFVHTTKVVGIPVFATGYSVNTPTWWESYGFQTVLIVIVGIEVVTGIIFFRRMNLISNRKFAGICMASIGFSIADCVLLGIMSAGMIGQEAMTKFQNLDKGFSLWLMVILLWIGFVVLTKKNATSVYNILQHKDWKMVNLRARTIVNMIAIILSTALWSFFIYLRFFTFPIM